jgi:hypothetical protein
MAEPRPFLTATWRYLAMLNYEVPPTLLRPLVSVGTELDTWGGASLWRPWNNLRELRPDPSMQPTGSVIARS